MLEQLDINMPQNETRHGPYTKVNSKQTIDINVKCKTIILLGENLCGLEFSDGL